MAEQTEPLSKLALIGIIGVAFAFALFTCLIALPFIYDFVMNDLFS